MRRVRFETDGEGRDGRFENDEIITDSETYATDEVTILPPCEPSKIIAAGKNYHDHIEEMKEKGVGSGELPERPFFFYKPPSSVIGHGDAIEYPDGAEVVHYEGEVGVVVGERCRNVPTDDALDVLAGYTALNDVSHRDWGRKEEQWVRHKGQDTFCPIGPSLQTDVEADVGFETHLNGEKRQDSRTSNTVFSIAELVSDISKYMTLEPGDVIATGTPSGVGQLSPGDTVEVTVEGVGTLRNDVR
ncbi:fumarylacetoacetate hydrolase family protein [Natrarchaeobius oligotrophus]|uniref:FAA hydrolase family protein n=1 Tax=Natrarchaeobius chitinivorans TaxID=1679083 RepID=A0A3N6PS71_NATCH|nr:fumarylacetoacetate hydrolase family protein [Natrarchaeobius chitinivorans]RQH02336.1 FAA hydrolase family protein [Natrarchaeobius chitinivorans]